MQDVDAPKGIGMRQAIIINEHF